MHSTTQPGVDCPPFPPPGPMLTVIAGQSEEGVGEGKGKSDEDNGDEDNDGHMIHHYLHGFCLHGCCKQGEGVGEGEGGMGVGGGEVVGMGHVGEGGVDDNNSVDVSLTWLLLLTSLLLPVWVRRQEEGQYGRCANPMPSSTLSITKAALSQTELSPSPPPSPSLQGQ